MAADRIKMRERDKEVAPNHKLCPPKPHPMPSTAPPHSRLFSATCTSVLELYTEPLPCTKEPGKKKRGSPSGDRVATEKEEQSQEMRLRAQGEGRVKLACCDVFFIFFVFWQIKLAWRSGGGA